MSDKPEKAFDKFQHQSGLKILMKQERERNILKMIAKTYKNPQLTL